MIGLVVKVDGKSEWWKVVIGWEENIGGEVVIFWDKSWGLKIVIFWDGGSSIRLLYLWLYCTKVLVFRKLTFT
jgi:hypothetical protein